MKIKFLFPAMVHLIVGFTLLGLMVTLHLMPDLRIGALLHDPRLFSWAAAIVGTLNTMMGGLLLCLAYRVGPFSMRDSA